MDYAMLAICQFVRVFHVRDFCCAYANIPLLGRFLAGNELFSEFSGRVQGLGALVPSRHERARAASACGGSAVGGPRPPYKYGYRVSVASGAGSLNACADAHGSSACNAQASACNARYRRKKEYRYYLGTVSNLMVTVPIDTTLIINELQIIHKKMWCQIMLFWKNGIVFSEKRFEIMSK